MNVKLLFILDIREHFDRVTITYQQSSIIISTCQRNYPDVAGNFHKWVYATRGCAILWVHPKHHKVIRPITTGHYFNHEIWQEDFMTQGTADNTAYYTCRKATEFYEGIGGMVSILCSVFILIPLSMS